jgi:hypothetical protein
MAGADLLMPLEEGEGEAQQAADGTALRSLHPPRVITVGGDVAVSGGGDVGGNRM